MHTVDTALQRVSQIDNGRFTAAFAGCDSFRETCFRCGYFDPREYAKYRCHVMGSCPAATLSPSAIKYVRERLDANP